MLLLLLLLLLLLGAGLLPELVQQHVEELAPIPYHTPSQLPRLRTAVLSVCTAFTPK
jgi:hypothetical protein